MRAIGIISGCVTGFIAGLAITLSGASAQVTFVGTGAEATIQTKASDGNLPPDSKPGKGKVAKGSPQSAKATKGAATAEGKVDDWNHIESSFDAAWAGAANDPASGKSDNTVTSTAELKGKEDHKAKVAIKTNLKWNLTDAEPATVTITVTVKNASNTAINTTSAAYKIAPDPTNPNKVEITEATKNFAETRNNDSHHDYPYEGDEFTLAHGAEGSAKFPIEFKVVTEGKTKKLAGADSKVSADVSFNIKVPK